MVCFFHEKACKGTTKNIHTQEKSQKVCIFTIFFCQCAIFVVPLSANQGRSDMLPVEFIESLHDQLPADEVQLLCQALESMPVLRVYRGVAGGK